MKIAVHGYVSMTGMAIGTGISCYLKCGIQPKGKGYASLGTHSYCALSPPGGTERVELPDEENDAVLEGRFSRAPCISNHHQGKGPAFEEPVGNPQHTSFPSGKTRTDLF